MIRALKVAALAAFVVVLALAASYDGRSECVPIASVVAPEATDARNDGWSRCEFLIDGVWVPASYFQGGQ